MVMFLSEYVLIWFVINGFFRACFVLNVLRLYYMMIFDLYGFLMTMH